VDCVRLGRGRRGLGNCGTTPRSRRWPLSRSIPRIMCLPQRRRTRRHTCILGGCLQDLPDDPVQTSSLPRTTHMHRKQGNDARLFLPPLPPSVRSFLRCSRRVYYQLLWRDRAGHSSPRWAAHGSQMETAGNAWVLRIRQQGFANILAQDKKWFDKGENVGVRVV
jgi:hypothetical protein